MKNAILILFALILYGPLALPASAAQVQWTPVSMTEADPQKEGLWGNIRFYTNKDIKLETGQHIRFSKNVLIDVENLANDDRGNVRILLDADGNAKAIFFNGIDMPDVIRRFKK